MELRVQADCLEDEEVQERKDELESLTAAGLQVPSLSLFTNASSNYPLTHCYLCMW